MCRPRLVRWLAGAFALLVPVSSAPCADDGTQQAEELLRANKVEPDNVGLAAFFRKRTLSDADQQKIQSLVRQLGDRSFARRNKASQALVEWGPSALRALQEALSDRDREISRRAAECITEINRGPSPALTLAALKVLAKRKPPGAVGLLVGYVPFADDATVADEVLATLLELEPTRGAIDPSLADALRDPLPERRAAAGYILGRHAQRKERERAEKLLKDPVITVRFRAAQGLLAGREKSAVPALIDLLPDLPADLRWQAEDLLVRLAGEAAPASLGAENGEGARKKWRDDWSAWWQKHGKTIELAKLDERTAFLNVTLVPEMHANKVWEFGPDGKVRWELTGDLGTPIDAQALPGGRVLIAELNGNRVTERDRTGRVLWQYAVKTPVAVERLPNGNTFISTNYVASIVTPAGKEVFSYKAEQGFYMHSVQRLRNGHIVCVSMDGVVREVDATGKEVRSISIKAEGGGWNGIQGLPGNRYLVCGSGKVIEIDATGKVLWRLNQAGACYAQRLPNGNTLVVDHSKGLIEVTREGKTIWDRHIRSLWRVHRR